MPTEEETKAARVYVEMRREQIRRQLHLLYLPLYDALCDALGDSFWAPYSGTRTLEEQTTIYQQGRTPESLAKGERIVTNAKPGDSAHNWGCATDWCEMRPEFRGGEIWNKADWAVFEKAVRQVKLGWGGDFPSPDRPHAQLQLTVQWREVGDVFRASGEAKAYEFILSKRAPISAP